MLEAYVLLSGRMGRLAYFGYAILLGVILGVIALIMLLPARGSDGYSTVATLTAVVVGAIGTWGSICLSVKRLHDLDLSGWHYLWIWLLPNGLNFLGNQQYGPGLFPLHPDGVQGPMAEALAQISYLQIVGVVIGLVLGLWLLFWPGTDGSNRFGYRP